MYLDFGPDRRAPLERIRRQIGERIAKLHPRMTLIIMEDMVSNKGWRFTISDGQVVRSSVGARPHEDAWMM